MLELILRVTLLLVGLGSCFDVRSELLSSSRSKCEMLGGMLSLAEVRSVAVLEFDYGHRRSVMVLLRPLDGGKEEFFSFDPRRQPELFQRIQGIAASDLHEGRFCVGKNHADLLSTMPERSKVRSPKNENY